MTMMIVINDLFRQKLCASQSWSVFSSFSPGLPFPHTPLQPTPTTTWYPLCLLIMNNRLYSQFLFGVKIAFLNSYPPVSGDQVNVISTCTLAISLVVVVQYGTLIALKRKPQVFENFQKIYKKNLRRHKCLILLPQFRVISHSLPRSKQLLKWNCLFPQFNKSHILTCT